MPKPDTNPDRLAELATLVAARIPSLIDEARDQINEAITVAVEDAQMDDKEAVISLPIAIKWNLDKSAIITALGVTVKRRFERVDKLEDPNQENLPLTAAEEDGQ